MPAPGSYEPCTTLRIIPMVTYEGLYGSKEHSKELRPCWWYCLPVSPVKDMDSGFILSGIKSWLCH